MTHLKRKIRLARAILFWEALWPALWPILGISGLFVLTALAGLFEILPREFHIGALIVFLLMAGWAARALFAVRIPNEQAALRYLEKISGLPHRPASSFIDEMSDIEGDEQSQTLWTAHKDRIAELVSKLKPGWPSPKLMARDPYALRIALVLGLIAAYFLGDLDWQTRLHHAVSPTEKARKSVWIEAWISPPSYTGKAPLFLIGKDKTNLPKRDIVEVPEGSQLVVRIGQAKNPKLIARIGQNLNQDKPAKPAVSFSKLSDDTNEAKLTLKRSQNIQINADSAIIAKWRFTIIADKKPVVEVKEPIQTTANNAIQFRVKLTDDYGVISARAHFKPIQEGVKKQEPVAPLEVDLPDFDITLLKTRTKLLEQKIFRYLTAHPWAGLKVSMHVSARDVAGKTGVSKPVVFTLPQRRFRNPLAKAIIEQRRKLVYDTNDRFIIATALDALSQTGDSIIKETGVYLGLRTGFNRLGRAQKMSEFKEITALLWEIALQVEDGNLSLAERELRRIQEQLARALANNASPQELKRLMSKLRQALNKYLRALAEQARRNPNRRRAFNNNRRNITPMDLNKLLDRLENLARTGARQAAQNLLAQLRNLLENLRMARPQRGRGDQQSALSRMLNGLSGLIGKQQRLMDRTFRRNNGQGQQGQQGQKGQKGNGLAGEQGSLADRLNDIMRQLGRTGLAPPSALGRAGRAMRDAEGALRSQRGQRALSRQGRALDQLRQGARALAREMRRRMSQRGRRGRGRVRGPNRDPLGRPMRTSGPEYGDTTKVPSEIEVQRAREIMRELQLRLGDRARPLLELDYIERLLRRF